MLSTRPKTKKFDVICSIPGGWYGNDVSQSLCQGNVVVDGERILDALVWLRRRAKIIRTQIITHTGEPGILITYVAN